MIEIPIPPAAKLPTAVELLREFANFQGDGIRSVIRMRRMQEKGITYLTPLEG